MYNLFEIQNGNEFVTMKILQVLKCTTYKLGTKLHFSKFCYVTNNRKSNDETSITF